MTLTDLCNIKRMCGLGLGCNQLTLKLKLHHLLVSKRFTSFHERKEDFSVCRVFKRLDDHLLEIQSEDI